MRNRGIMVQELRVLENTVSDLKRELEDLKNKIGFKNSNSESQSLSKNDTESGLNLISNIKQMMDGKLKNLKRDFEKNVDQYASELKSLEIQLVKFEKDMSK